MWETMMELKEESILCLPSLSIPALSLPNTYLPAYIVTRNNNKSPIASGRRLARQTSGDNPEAKLLNVASSHASDITNDDLIDIIDDDTLSVNVSATTPINSSSRASPIIPYDSMPTNHARVSPLLPSTTVTVPTSPGRAIRRSGLVVRDGSHIQMEKVTITTPSDGRTLVTNLSFTVTPGQSLLIVGPSGCGKSSVLRTIAGLWPATKGRLTKPSRIGAPTPTSNSLFFVPQRPFLTLGTFLPFHTASARLY
jgi:ABC-type multidrug transport system fused ATPase/permease subunit